MVTVVAALAPTVAGSGAVHVVVAAATHDAGICGAVAAAAAAAAAVAGSGAVGTRR